jgi:pyridoxamine 5'-phosphate oxidase
MMNERAATPLDDAQLADSVLPAGADPFVLFEEWFAAALVGELNDPNAMALATATASESATGVVSGAVCVDGAGLNERRSCSCPVGSTLTSSW